MSYARDMEVDLADEFVGMYVNDFTLDYGDASMKATFAAPAELKFWINGKEAAGGTVQRTVPLTFTASETFDVGRDTMSPVADDYFDKAPFAFEGTLNKLHFKNLENQ